MSAVTITEATFSDFPGMPHVHTDKEGRRTITEAIVYKDDNLTIHVRNSRIQVLGTDVQLGNHYHDFDEKFTGTGGGLLYTAPADDPTEITSHVLPKDGWATTIPAGVVHTFVLSAPAVLVSSTDQHFVSPDNQHEHPHVCVNTHAEVLDLSRFSA